MIFAALDAQMKTMQMKNPKTNRTLGYIVLFFDFWLWYKGFHYPTPEDLVNGKSPALIVLAVVLFIAVTVWMFMKVRCPHCGQLLPGCAESPVLQGGDG